MKGVFVSNYFGVLCRRYVKACLFFNAKSRAGYPDPAFVSAKARFVLAEGVASEFIYNILT